MASSEGPASPPRAPGVAQAEAANASPPDSMSRRLILILPVMHRSIFEAVHRQVGAFVGVTGGQLLVDVDTEAGRVAGMEGAVRERVGVREDGVGLVGV